MLTNLEVHHSRHLIVALSQFLLRILIIAARHTYTFIFHEHSNATEDRMMEKRERDLNRYLCSGEAHRFKVK